MNLNDYAEKAMETEADQEVIANRLGRLTESNYKVFVRLNNGITGLSDEIGELNSALKKWIEYGQPLDRENVKEEVGDCLWRLAQICKACDFTLDKAAEANIEKLQRHRYKEGYSDEAAREENRDRISEASVMRSTDELTQEVIDQVNEKKCKGKLCSPVANSQMMQTGQGFAEPPEAYDDYQTDPLPNESIQIQPSQTYQEAYDNNGPEEEDGPWAEGWEKRSGIEESYDDYQTDPLLNKAESHRYHIPKFPESFNETLPGRLIKSKLDQVISVWEDAAIAIAGMVEGQDHKMALKMIERAKEQTQ